MLIYTVVVYICGRGLIGQNEEENKNKNKKTVTQKRSVLRILCLVKKSSMSKPVFRVFG